MIIIASLGNILVGFLGYLLLGTIVLGLIAGVVLCSIWVWDHYTSSVRGSVRSQLIYDLSKLGDGLCTLGIVIGVLIIVAGVGFVTCKVIDRISGL